MNYGHAHIYNNMQACDHGSCESESYEVYLK